jgi:hypothetical protein
MGMRAVQFENTRELIRERPWFGVGSGGFGEAYTAHVRGKYTDRRVRPSGEPHNQCLFFLAEQVTFGLTGSCPSSRWRLPTGAMADRRPSSQSACCWRGARHRCSVPTFRPLPRDTCWRSSSRRCWRGRVPGWTQDRSFDRLNGMRRHDGAVGTARCRCCATSTRTKRWTGAPAGYATVPVTERPA